MAGSHLTKDFFSLVKSIGESKSKQEEDRIITFEVKKLKNSLKARKRNRKQAREFLIRIIYCEMLGHDCSFGYIRGIELCASGSLHHKRAGYLCASLTLHPEHEFRFMLVNQLQNDLKNANILVKCAALIAISKLITRDMIPALYNNVHSLITHEVAIVRKKAAMALHRFYQLAPDAITDQSQTFRRILCDKDPSVMGASLCMLESLITDNEQAYKDLIPSFVSVLKQISEHRLPRDFDYHRVPAPWLQIKLLKIVGILCNADQQASEHVYEVLSNVMKRADTGSSVGFAIIYECVKTITKIYPNAMLLDAAAAAIARFISNDSQNLKYLGVTGLAAVVQDHPKYAKPHQMVVLDCLEDPDETIQRKTLDLLYRMTNPENCTIVVGKLTDYLRKSSDVYVRTELVARITQLAERYAPESFWFIQTMATVFELGGNLVQSSVADNLRNLIAEGTGEEDDDDRMRKKAVELFISLTDKSEILPDILQQVIAWTLGEYGYVVGEDRFPDIARILCTLIQKPHDEETTEEYIITALVKLTSQMGVLLDNVKRVMMKHCKSRNSNLQQRCNEFLSLSGDFDTLREMYPLDASMEDLEVDEDLSFMNSFVVNALDNGAIAYDASKSITVDASDFLEADNDDGGWNFDAYEKPDLNNANFANTTDDNFMNEEGDPHEDEDEDQNNMQDDIEEQEVGGPWSESGFANEKPSPKSTQRPVSTFDETPIEEANMDSMFGDVQEQESDPLNDFAETIEEEDEYEMVTIEEEVIEELTEKEKMAAQLFGGSTSPRRRIITRQVRRKKERKNIPIEVSTNGVNSSQNTISNVGNDDLMGLGLENAYNDDAPDSNMNTSGDTNANDVMGLFNVSEETNNNNDILGSMYEASNLEMTDASNELQLSSSLQNIVDSGTRLPQSGAEDSSENADLSISYFTVKLADKLAIFFIFSDKTNQGINNAKIGFRPIKDMVFSFDGDSFANANNNVVNGFNVNASSTSVVAVSLTCRGAAGIFAQSLQGQIQYSSGLSLNFNAQLDVSNWLRPLKLSTSDFGKRWGSGLSEISQDVTTGCGSAAEFMGVLQASVHLTSLEVKQASNEGIMAAKIAGTPVVILLHGKLQPQSSALKLTVKSQVQKLSASVFSMCESQL